MRQKLGEKKIKQLRHELDMPDIIHVLVRGGTDHRRDLLMKDGSVIYLYKDGMMEKAENLSWNLNRGKEEE